MPSLDQLLADLTSGDEPRAETAAVQIVSVGKQAFDALVRLSQHPNPDTRWWALRALSEFSVPDPSPIFIKALTDTVPEVQACAALSLRLHPNPESIEFLLALLEHQDQLLARLAGDALAAIGFEATKPLIERVEEEHYSHLTRLEAVRALAVIQDPTSISTLFKMYQDGSSMMQHWAEEGLNRMGIGMVFFDPN
ncbi:MAG: hypothetical protein GWN14_08750 [candidate division Zixibacteria bacterium]|nr:hypothetical protein [Gammaproteobacteria bacterium]NIX55999.1 hypothetical protein [candidate division Zixibacteria bacterium]